MADEKESKARPIHVSPRYTVEHLADASIDHRIDVFEDQVHGFVLQHAEALLAKDYAATAHAGIAVLMLSTAYFEQIACYLMGESSRGRELEFFHFGFREVFSDLEANLADPKNNLKDPRAALEKIIKAVYVDLRCGLFHEAMVRGNILVRTQDAPVAFMLAQEDGTVGSVSIDPKQFFEAIRSHFSRYVAQLRDPKEKELRERFDKFLVSRAPKEPGVLPPDLEGLA